MFIRLNDCFKIKQFYETNENKLRYLWKINTLNKKDVEKLLFFSFFKKSNEQKKKKGKNPLLHYKNLLLLLIILGC